MERVYVYKYPTAEKHYQADAYVHRCVDDRFYKTWKNFLRSRGILRIDPKSPAGGAKVFVEEGTIREHYLNEIAISIRLHGVARVLLFTHHDCGAYGGFGKFDNDFYKEFEFHAEELEKAKKVVQERFPDLIVEAYFIDNEGVVKVE